MWSAMSCRCKGPFALFVILVLFILPSCDRVRINRTLNQMLSKEVVAPAALEKVQMDTIGSSSLDPRAKCILYIDSTECSSCRIGHLAVYSDLYRRSQESSAFDFVVVISPKAKERERAVSQIHYQIEFPVYIDDGSKFLSLNPWIPQDSRFHCFLTDQRGRVVHVGDPTWSDKSKALFLEAVGKLP